MNLLQHIVDIFHYFFECGLFFLPFPFLCLLIRNYRHCKPMDEKQAKKFALGNSIIAGAIMCLYQFVGSWPANLTFLVSELTIPVIHAIPYFWISHIILTKGTYLKENKEEDV